MKSKSRICGLCLLVSAGFFLSAGKGALAGDTEAPAVRLMVTVPLAGV